MKIIDLSKEIYSGMPIYPGDPEVVIKPIETKEDWQVSQLTLGTHTGTHTDAFTHMIKGAASIDQIDLKQFMGPAQLVRQNDANFPEDIGLLFDESVDESVLERILASKPPFVAGDLSEGMERALLSHRIVTITDLINLDQLPYGQTFLFIGLPLKINGGDGSPVRAVAVIDIL
ncbi:cyclase family protein [Aerococcaceae bacterium WGS1372]